MKALFNTKSIVGRVVIVLLFTGGLVFAGTFSVNTFVPTSAVASSCCAGAAQDAASDDVSGESNGCCAEKGSTISASSSCCSHSNCPGTNPEKTCNTCGGSDRGCSCSPPEGQTCSCSTRICKKGSYSCEVGPGSCYSGS